MRVQVQRIAFAVLGLLLSSKSLAAQQVIVRGMVRDSISGRPLAGAIVGLGASGADRTTRTDDGGAFAFSKVVPGAYAITVRRLGLTPIVD